MKHKMQLQWMQLLTKKIETETIQLGDSKEDLSVDHGVGGPQVTCQL